mmetsp:Transcript_123598/g.395366  ORF Transcript_123598/g.395366 Transcript_123598/m.395366 type:complete len:518 (+) Transcript_123598:80-1633(+)
MLMQMAQPNARRALPTRTLSPGRPRQTSPRAPLDPAQAELQKRVKDLEGAIKQDQRAKVQDDKKRQKELADAKKRINKELQMAAKFVKKGEQDVSKMSNVISRIEDQAEQVKTRKTRQSDVMEEKIGSMRAKRNSTEGTLQEKVALLGEARGKLAHIQFAAKMLEHGVIIPTDGMLDSPDGASIAEAHSHEHQSTDMYHSIDGQGTLPESESRSNALEEENRLLRELLRDAELKLAQLSALTAGTSQVDTLTQTHDATSFEDARAGASIQYTSRSAGAHLVDNAVVHGVVFDSTSTSASSGAVLQGGLHRTVARQTSSIRPLGGHTVPMPHDSPVSLGRSIDRQVHEQAHHVPVQGGMPTPLVQSGQVVWSGHVGGTPVSTVVQSTYPTNSMMGGFQSMQHSRIEPVAVPTAVPQPPSPQARQAPFLGEPLATTPQPLRYPPGHFAWGNQIVAARSLSPTFSYGSMRPPVVQQVQAVPMPGGMLNTSARHMSALPFQVRAPPQGMASEPVAIHGRIS